MKKNLLIILICLTLLITGCTKKENNNGDPNIPEPIPEPTLQIVDPDSKSRPLAVMINNHNSARTYHTGLQDAYITYEIIVEGGLTRLMAVFKDKDLSKIGSVRSSRHYFLDYALENDAIYVHFGWSPKAQSDISTLKVKNVNGLYDSGFWRETLPIAYEHTAFTKTSNILDVASKRGYSLESNQELLLNYSIKEININEKEDSAPANNVIIRYSDYMTTTYKYDDENKVYKRIVNGKDHVDYETKKQYTAKNIIITKIKNYMMDSYGRQDLNNVGTGDGYFITNGYSVPIKWKKSARDSQTTYTYLDGTEITVNDGNTYIQVQPIYESTIISE